MTLIDSRPGVHATCARWSRRRASLIDPDVVVARLGPPLERELAEWVPADQVDPLADRYRELYVEIGIEGMPRPARRGRRARRGAASPVGGGSWSPRSSSRTRGCASRTRTSPSTTSSAGATARRRERRSPSAAAAIYVGDTPPDIDAAHLAGAIAVGVPSGPFTAAELARRRRRRRPRLPRSSSPTGFGARSRRSSRPNCAPKRAERHPLGPSAAPGPELARDEDHDRDDTDDHADEQHRDATGRGGARARVHHHGLAGRHREHLRRRLGQVRGDPEPQRMPGRRPAAAGPAPPRRPAPPSAGPGARHRWRSRSSASPGPPIPENDHSVRNVDVVRVTRTSRNGPSAPFSSATTAPASSARANPFDTVSTAPPPLRRSHPDDRHPAAVRSSNPHRRLQLHPRSLHRRTAAASNRTRAVTAPDPSSRTATVTSASTRHPANTTTTQHARREPPTCAPTESVSPPSLERAHGRRSGRGRSRRPSTKRVG